MVADLWHTLMITPDARPRSTELQPKATRPIIQNVRVAWTLLPFAICGVVFASQLPGPRVAHKKGVANNAAEDRLDQYWKKAQAEVYKSPEEITAQQKRELRTGSPIPELIHGSTKRKWLALTFDDGPHPIYTQKLIDILKRENVPATFFVIGFMAEKYPDLIRDEVKAGFSIGNHTFSHVTLTHLPASEANTEYRACSDVLQNLTGARPIYCRPPGGDYDRDVITAARDNGMITVLWTDDPGDFANPGSHVIEKRTLQEMTNGGIILLHDGVQQTLDVLPQIIAYARREGYKFVSLGDMYSGARE